MNIPQSVTSKKSIIIELIVLVLFLVGIYFVYTSFVDTTPTVDVATPALNQQLLGANLVVLLKAASQNSLSLGDASIMNSKLVKDLQDNTQNISENLSRGRLDPFTSYASSRPLR